MACFSSGSNVRTKPFGTDGIPLPKSFRSDGHAGHARLNFRAIRAVPNARNRVVSSLFGLTFLYGCLWLGWALGELERAS